MVQPPTAPTQCSEQSLVLSSVDSFRNRPSHRRPPHLDRLGLAWYHISLGCPRLYRNLDPAILVLELPVPVPEPARKENRSWCPGSRAWDLWFGPDLQKTSISCHLALCLATPSCLLIRPLLINFHPCGIGFLRLGLRVEGLKFRVPTAAS